MYKGQYLVHKSFACYPRMMLCTKTLRSVAAALNLLVIFTLVYMSSILVLSTHWHMALCQCDCLDVYYTKGKYWSSGSRKNKICENKGKICFYPSINTHSIFYTVCNIPNLLKRTPIYIIRLLQVPSNSKNKYHASEYAKTFK